jgi:hypothetical protein
MVYVRKECYGMPVKKQLETIGGSSPTDDAAVDIEVAAPCVVTVTIEGTAPILFHRWSCEAVAEKAAAAKNSAAKKSDNIESYVYRNEAGEICLPGEYVRMAIIGAARYRQDPRSPRKSAMDLYKAGVVSLTELASLGCTDWDYLDRRRVTVNRSGITRERPAMRAGWTAEFQMLINIPEYIPAQTLHSVLNDAGRLVGVGDFRPSYGRFLVKSFAVDI